MKIVKYIILAASLSSIFLASCKSTDNIEADVNELMASEASKKSKQSKKNSGTNKTSEKSGSEAKPEVKETIVTVTVTPHELYLQKINGILLSVTSVPPECVAGKPFARPYVIKAANAQNAPVSGYEIAVILPVKDPAGNISNQKVVVKTNESGIAEYLPPVPARPVDGFLTFYPDADTSDSEIAATVEKIAVKASYKVQTSMKSAGGVIAIVDFNDKGKPVTSNPVSSSNLLMSLMKLGFTKIGNIDLTNDVLSEDSTRVYNRAKAIVGSSSAFVVYGTVKVESLEKSESGTTAVLCGDIKCLDLKTGKIIHTDTQRVSASEKSEWNAIPAARKLIADAFGKNLKYGL